MPAMPRAPSTTSSTQLRVKRVVLRKRGAEDTSVPHPTYYKDQGLPSPVGESGRPRGLLYFDSIARATISEMSSICILSSASTPLMPSSNIVMQNGHAAASTSAPVSSASLTRVWLTRLPIFSSIQARPPPPPQQKLLLRWRRISVTPLLLSTVSTRRGSSYMSL